MVAAATLTVLLIVKVVARPNMPPIQMGAYESEYDCRKAAKAIDNSTKIKLKLTCEVRT